MGVMLGLDPVCWKRLLAAGGVAIGFIAAPQLATAQTYGIATMQPGTLSHTSGTAIAKVLYDKLQFQARVQPTAGESTLLPLVNNGEIDVGIANVFEVIDAYEGRSLGKQDKLRLVAAIHPLRVGFFVRKDSGIKTVADLKGKRITLGFSTQLTLQRVALAILATAGLSLNDVKAVQVPNVIRAAEEMANGNADAFLFGLGAAKVKEVDATVGGLGFAGVIDTPEALAAARKILPQMYLTTVNPRFGETGILERTVVPTYDNTLSTSSAVKEDIIYKIVDALVTNKSDLAATAPWLMELNADQLYKTLPVPYHPGAVKWFNEKGIAQKSN